MTINAPSSGRPIATPYQLRHTEWARALAVIRDAKLLAECRRKAAT